MQHLSLTENHLFGKAYTNGRRWCERHVCVFVLKDKAAFRLMKANPEKQYLNRVGLSVGKRLGGAVARNRAKRLIREAYAAVKREPGLRTGYLVVLAARDEIVGKKSGDVEKELRRAFRTLGLLREEKNKE